MKQNCSQANNYNGLLLMRSNRSPGNQFKATRNSIKNKNKIQKKIQIKRNNKLTCPNNHLAICLLQTNELQQFQNNSSSA